MADVDHRGSVQARAGDVELARDHQVRLIEAPRPLPREVRVGEHDAAAGLGGVRADPPAVRAGVLRHVERVGEVGCLSALLRADRFGRRRVGVVVALRRDRRRLRLGDPIDGDAAARVLGQLVEALVDVHLGDRANPGLAGAGRIGDVRDPGLLQIAVVAGDVSLDHLLDLGLGPDRRLAGVDLLDRAPVLEALEEQVGVEIAEALGTLRVRAEPLRALGVAGQVGVGDHADVVGGKGVAVAEAEVLVRVGLDRRDPLLVAGDLGLQPPALLGLRDRRCHDADRQRADDRRAPSPEPGTSLHLSLLCLNHKRRLPPRPP